MSNIITIKYFDTCKIHNKSDKLIKLANKMQYKVSISYKAKYCGERFTNGNDLKAFQLTQFSFQLKCVYGTFSDCCSFYIINPAVILHSSPVCENTQECIRVDL